jgi:hypothetical protein
MEGPLPATRDLLLALWDRMSSAEMPSAEMSPKRWTRWFQVTAAEVLTEGRQHASCCGRGEEWEPEYMVDAAVSEDHPDAKDDDPFAYTRLLLAIETEWSTNQWNREYDFCKLADIRAERKLYACEVSKKVWKQIDERVIDRFAKFWDQHVMVATGEEVGLMISSGENYLGAWVLRKGSRPEPLRVSE